MRTTTRNASVEIAARRDFTTSGALSGQVLPPRRWPSTGYLPTGWVNELEAHEVDYVVYSYSTPIAWHRTDGTWVIPDVSYSVTTSRHQGQARLAAYGENVITRLEET